METTGRTITRTGWTIAVLSSIVVLAVACGSSSSTASGGGAPTSSTTSNSTPAETDPAATAPLVGTTWKLVSVTDTEAQPPTSAVTGDDEFTLQLPTATSIQWRACNSYSGSVTVTPTTITMGQIQSTLMACEGPASQAESDMGAVMAGTVTYTIDAAGLHLTNGTRGLDFVAT